MHLDITLYSTSSTKITLDDFRSKLSDIFPFMQAMSDMDPADSTTRWFLSVGQHTLDHLACVIQSQRAATGRTDRVTGAASTGLSWVTPLPVP